MPRRRCWWSSSPDDATPRTSATRTRSAAATSRRSAASSQTRSPPTRRPPSSRPSGRAADQPRDRARPGWAARRRARLVRRGPGAGSRPTRRAGRSCRGARGPRPARRGGAALRRLAELHDRARPADRGQRRRASGAGARGVAAPPPPASREFAERLAPRPWTRRPRGARARAARCSSSTRRPRADPTGARQPEASRDAGWHGREAGSAASRPRSPSPRRSPVVPRPPSTSSLACERGARSRATPPAPARPCLELAEAHRAAGPHRCRRSTPATSRCRIAPGNVDLHLALVGAVPGAGLAGPGGGEGAAARRKLVDLGDDSATRDPVGLEATVAERLRG